MSDARSLSPEETTRYSRHLMLPQVGMEGQLRLANATVLLIGAGGLGSPVALYLAAAGVGTLGLVEFDVVDLSNLQRQILHGTSGVGRPKLESAAARLADINPNVSVIKHPVRLAADNALEIMKGYDVIVDGSDNFATRYLANDAAVMLGKPLVYGAVHRFEGQASVFATKDGPCYRCLFREPPPSDLVPNCAEAGVLGVVPGLVGTIQANETIKLILGIGQTLAGRLLLIDALSLRFREIAVRRDPACPACGTREITRLMDYDAYCAAAAPEKESAAAISQIQPAELAKRLENGDQLELIDVREDYEWALGHIPGARHVPLGDIPAEISGFDFSRETVLYCKAGVRSMHAARQLAAAGVKRIHNLSGGIMAWIDDVDPTLPRY